MQNHKIRWTEETWNTGGGCSKVDRACMHCYAEIMAGRIVAMNTAGSKKYLSTVEQMGGSSRWTGKVTFGYEYLTKPIKNARKSVYFVNSMTDLFHVELSVEQIAAVFVVMLECRRHIFQVLTKRSERMQELLSDVKGFTSAMARASRTLAAKRIIKTPYPIEVIRDNYPLSNVWLGNSVGTAATKYRLDHLRNTPAEVRFLSCEPLIENIVPLDLTGIHWVICGGESGWANTVAPMHPDWARALKKECQFQNVPFFFKQWGRWLPWERAEEPFYRSQNGQKADSAVLFPNDWEKAINAGKWHDGVKFMKEGYGDCVFESVGKGGAGNTLDGKVCEEFPKQLIEWDKKQQ